MQLDGSHDYILVTYNSYHHRNQMIYSMCYFQYIEYLRNNLLQ